MKAEPYSVEELEQLNDISFHDQAKVGITFGPDIRVDRFLATIDKRDTTITKLQLDLLKLDDEIERKDEYAKTRDVVIERQCAKIKMMWGIIFKHSSAKNDYDKMVEKGENNDDGTNGD